jgi:vacuolar-type H+-ATPase subunit E/Vma4
VSVDGILRAIRADTDARMREIADAAAADVAAIGARADADASRAETDAATALDHATDREVAMVVDRARLDARRAGLRALEAAYQATLDQVRDRLGQARDSPAYRDTLSALLAESLRVVHDPARAIVDADDVGIVKEILAERGLDDVVVTPTPADARGLRGGIDVETGDGRIVRNTLDSRLRRADPRLRAIVAGRLPAES